MAEVVDWSPVDESNNSPPPVGAPEHHAPSATNNIARAMMGSIRRWHDSVSTQLSNCLKLTGGVVSGNTSFNGPLGISIQGTWLDGDGAGNLIVRNVASGNNAGAIVSTGTGAAFMFGDRNMVSPNWTWHASGGTARLGTYGASPIITVTGMGQVTVTGNLTTTGILATTGSLNATDITATGAITGNQVFTTLGIHAGGSIAADFHIVAGGDITVGDAITAGGAITGNQVFTTLGIHADGSIGADFHVTAGGDITAGDDITAGGNVTAAGTVIGNFLRSTGGMHADAGISADGVITADGNISTAADFSAVNITATAQITGAYLHSTGAIHADGAIDSDTNISANGNISADGNVTAGYTVFSNSVSATDIHGSGSLSTRDATGGLGYALFSLGTTSYLQFLAPAGNANRWEFDGTNGDMQWRSLNVVQWVMRRSPIGSSDNMCFNAVGPVGGYGAYYNYSDRRGKDGIESDVCGLDAILCLDPVSFRRIGQSDREIGFVAQELREVIPEAVRVVGIPLPDGTGGPEDENPTLGVDTTPIIAALVNAMKEISGRISILEGKRHE